MHLAWDGLPNYRSLHHFETELPKQYRFLREVVSRGLKSLLVTGTCFEYGMQNGELSESLICMPDNPYGYAKDALRRQLTFLKTEFQFNLTWARLFYMYGEGQGSKSIYSLRLRLSSAKMPASLCLAVNNYEIICVLRRLRNIWRNYLVSRAMAGSSMSAPEALGRCAESSKHGWRRTIGGLISV